MATRVALHTTLILHGYIAMGLQIIEKHAYSERTSVAVCVTGQLRTHTYPIVQQAFANNFHKPGYEYFFIVDKVDFDAGMTLLKPVRAIVHGGGDNISREYVAPSCEPHENTGLISGRRKIPMVARHVVCNDAIEAYEKTSTSKYVYVMRLRPDNLFVKPIPHVTDLLTSSGRDVGMFGDHMAYARRENADMVFLNLWRLFNSCYSDADYERACKLASCDGISFSCRTFYLIMKFSDWKPTLAYYGCFSRTLNGCEYPIEKKSFGVYYDAHHKEGKNKNNANNDGFVPYFRAE